MFLTQTRLSHFSRNIKQRLSSPKVGVIGGYHGGNLGDMALGEAVTSVLSIKGIKTGLQTIYNLNKWPVAPYAIVGGGAVGYIGSLKQVAERYKGAYNKVALLGVDFNEKEYPEQCLNLIKGAAFVSCRSGKQADRLMQLTERSNIFHHPDIAFSLLNKFCAEQRQSEVRKEKKLLVNVVPLYGKIQNGKVVPIEQYKDERPDLYDNFNIMQESYSKVVRKTVVDAIKQGYKVETIPFTPWDAEYGKIILDGLAVKHASYQSNPSKMLKNIANAERVIATRYHATIFALKTGAKISPIAYATKNELMLQELGVDRGHFLSTGDLANGKSELFNTIKADAGKMDAWETEASRAVNKCISALL